MKKKRLMIVGIIAVLLIAVGLTTVSQSSKMSEKSFDAVVQEVVTMPDGEVRLIVERTTEIYSNPVNSLSIGEETKLLNSDGKEISVKVFKQGSTVTVKLKDAFTEETPFYYPTVYEIKLISN